MSSLLMLLLASPAARAQSVERPFLPFRSVAGEDGVHVLYSNPALMGFDKDAGYAVYYDTTSVEGGLDSLTFATTGSGVGAGIGYRQWGTDGDGWWTITSGASIPLADSLTFGTTLNWQLPDGGDNNFVSWDLGLGWRPVPFLGFGGAALNLGNPAPDLGVYTTYDAGLAVRPFGDVITVGADYLAITPPDTVADQRVQASLRLRPVRGLWIRAWGEQGITDPERTSFGGALEVHFADVGVGVTARSSLADPGVVGGGGYVETVPHDDQLFRSNRGVATFTFDSGYPYQPMGGLLQGPAPEGYLTLLRRIESASKDRQVRGLLFEVEAMPFSMAQIEEIRGIIAKARANGKKVVAYLDGEASNGAYLLAAACDKVYLHPAGNLDLVGLSAELQFYRGALDMVGVGAQYAKRGEYKSAPEQWTNEQSSDASREEMDALLDDLYATLVDGIAQGRNMKADDVRALIDKGPFTGDEALKANLVDGLVYKDKLDEKLEADFRAGWTRDEEYGASPDESGWKPQRAVAVVVVDGVISEGNSSPGGLLGGAATGSKTVVKALDQARRADAVKAVVLRVDSPGGSAFASDEIWRAVQRVREAGKPVVVSMGGYAASGGYYVSSGADAIYAEPSTVTGSIGVFGGKFNGAGLFDKLDIHTEEFARGRNATMYSIAKPFDDVEYAALDRMIADTYRQFKEKVRDGRGLTDEKVEEIARGRVWSGADAKERGLVDEWGGFYDAVERARSEAHMAPNAPWELVTFDPWVGEGQDLPAYVIRAFTPKVETPPQLQPFFDLAALKDERVFAMLPWRLEIH